MTQIIKTLKDRDTLGEFFAEQKCKTGAEIGVQQGIFSETLLAPNPELKLYLVDPWKSRKGHFILNKGEILESTQSIMDTFYENTLTRLKAYNNLFVIRKSSMDALAQVPDESLDFVYIDANHHFDFVMADIIGWSKKVRPGGIVSGHDYIMGSKTSGSATSLFFDVKYAVEAYATAHTIQEVYILGGQGNPSWLWFKDAN
jgi:hypothetical protein